MNRERTISIRKRIHLTEGVVQTRARQVCGELIEARDISCTIRVDVPVLTELPARISEQDCEDLDDPADAVEALLHEYGLKSDDEIGLLARAVPKHCRFRRQESSVVYVRASQPVIDLLGDRVTRLTTCMLGAAIVDGFVKFEFVENDTPVVVRVRDILPNYELPEDK